MKNLIDKNYIFVSNADDKDEVFEEIYKSLYKDDLVTKNFLDMVKEREKNYPTGMDMSVVGGINYNIAIPHTESYAVKTSLVVPIQLRKELTFNNMIEPDQEIKVKFLFLILNDGSDEQTDILARIMDFVTKTENINDLFEIYDEDEIYSFIKNNL
ncbi:MAG: PTS sugar transporter subunit IIA [Peptoniphilaceae bacterium]|nr:PTS sugar transporter subunit IIA [Peptoniphilaceae bacterium]MDY6018267.1 PTS sugar transporter subunit IIA [Anaerococcus sp.]